MQDEKPTEPSGDDTYHAAVDLVRDITANMARNEKLYFSERIACLDRTEPIDDRPLEEQFDEIERAGEVDRKMENVALLALGDVATEYDWQTALEAAEEAGADWLQEALFRRAWESARHDHGSADWPLSTNLGGDA